MRAAAPPAVMMAPGLIDAIVQHARHESPRECCGFLLGTASRIDETVAVVNIAAGRSRYLIDPADHIQLNKRLRGTARSIVGVYHSHPRGPAEPSAADVAEAYYPEFVHIIVSLDRADAPLARAFRIAGGRVTPVPLVEAEEGP